MTADFNEVNTPIPPEENKEGSERGDKPRQRPSFTRIHGQLTGSENNFNRIFFGKNHLFAF
jgi:hypothetical protein